MTINSDFSVATNGNIRYIGAAHGASGAGYYTVLELHRWLQDLADDAASSGDDYMDISKLTPSDRSYDTIITLQNGYNIDDTASEHLYGGSIIQTSGDVIYDGVQVIAGSGCNVQIMQNGARLTNDFWNNTPFGASAAGLNADSTNGIAMRFLLKVRTGAADIDGRRLLLQTRVLGFTYSEFKINGTGRGINVAALTYLTDLNNQTASGTISGWSDITNLNAGYNLMDVDGVGGNEAYYSKWDKASRTIVQLYEYIKYLTRRGSAATLYGLNGELFRGITHEVAVTTPRSGSVSEGVSCSWSGGTGQVIARDSAGTATKLWIQLLTGVAPTAGQTITVGAATVTAAGGTPSTERPVPGAQALPVCGTCTGSALLGAYGFGVEVADLGVNDRVTDLTNTVIQPQNLVTFTVTGLVSGEDYVLVGPEDGAGGLKTNQFALSGALTGAAVTSVVVGTSIPLDTPATGTIRIKRANGAYTKHSYTSYSGSTFTIASTDFSSNNAPNATDVFISYIDTLAGSSSAQFQCNYVSSRTLFVRRRDGGGTPTKTFETTATLGASGGSVSVQRISDV